MIYDEYNALDLAFPVVFTDDDVAYVEQGSDQEVQQRVFAMLAYEPGQLISDPSFGTPDQSFQKGGVQDTTLQASLERMDPTVSEFIDSNLDWFLTASQTISVRRDAAND